MVGLVGLARGNAATNHEFKEGVTLLAASSSRKNLAPERGVSYYQDIHRRYPSVFKGTAPLRKNFHEHD
jgi:hypothetical protein